MSKANQTNQNWYCPICKTSHVENKLNLRLSFPQVPLLRIYRCHCGLIYTDYAVKGAAPDVYDSTYYDQVRYSDSTGRNLYVEHIGGFLNRVIEAENFQRNSGRLIDIGCATGDFVAWARNQGWDAEGIDIASAAVTTGQKRGLPLRLGSVDELNKYPSTFDVITLWDVIEHLPDTTQVLKSVHKALKPEGLFFIKTVSSGSLLDLIARGLYLFSFGKIQMPLKRMYVLGHLYTYNRDIFSRYLMQERWRVIRAIHADTPAEALFPPGIARVAFKRIARLQSFFDRTYELLFACRKSSI